MGYNDRLSYVRWDRACCPKCKEAYECREEEQEPGCRSKDYEICPYCGEVIQSSMEYEFTTRKLTDC